MLHTLIIISINYQKTHRLLKMEKSNKEDFFYYEEEDYNGDAYADDDEQEEHKGSISQAYQNAKPYQQKQQKNDEDQMEDWDKFREQVEAVAAQNGTDKELKDALVRQEILEKGYAPQDFEYYLQKVKDSNDLNKWGMAELKSVILEFQDHQFAQMLQNEDKYFDPYSAKSQMNPNMSTQGQPLIPNEKVPKIMPFLNQYQPNKFLSVTQLKPSILNKNIKLLQLRVINPKIQQVTEFLFIKTNQLQFTILTTPVKWEVNRSEADLYLLRKLLQVSFPHLLIPPLPCKQESKFTKKSLASRCLRFTRFLSAVCRNDELCTYQLLVEFLMMKHKDAKTFTEKMKQEEMLMSKYRVPLKPDVNELTSMYDKISTNLLPEAVSFDLPLFIERHEQHNVGLIEDSKIIRDRSNSLHQSCLKFQEILMKLSQFHQHDSLSQLDAFANLSKVMGADGYIIQQQGESFLDAMKYLKYNIEYSQPLRELQLKAEHAKSRFLKAEKNFLTKREKVIGQVGQQNQQKISQALVDSLLPMETQELERATQFMNFYTNQLLQEVRRMQFQMEFPGMQANFKQLTKECTDGLNQRNVYWSGLIKAMSKEDLDR